MVRRALQSHSWHPKMFLIDFHVSISFIQMIDLRLKLRNGENVMLTY